MNIQPTFLTMDIQNAKRTLNDVRPILVHELDLLRKYYAVEWKDQIGNILRYAREGKLGVGTAVPYDEPASFYAYLFDRDEKAAFTASMMVGSILDNHFEQFPFVYFKGNTKIEGHTPIHLWLFLCLDYEYSRLQEYESLDAISADNPYLAVFLAFLEEYIYEKDE